MLRSPKTRHGGNVVYPSAALSVNLNSTRVNMDANSYKLHGSGYYDVLLLGKLPIMVSRVATPIVFYLLC
jgi:hypothetical protein